MADVELEQIQPTLGDQQQIVITQNDDKPPFKQKPRPPPFEVVEDVLGSQSGPKTPLTPGSQSQATAIPGVARRRKDRERKIGHRRVDELGQVTYKRIETSQICGSIQLGISYAVGGLASKPERDLLMQDFAMVETTSFIGSGSSITPAHRYSDFKLKTYAPVAFRYFRDLFGIQPEDFLLSVANEPMIELSNPGASGSVFYLTMDDEFIIKTVQHKEAEFLQKLLPGYYMNLNQNPRTLLPKFFGLYCYICGKKNVRVCVMNNLLPSSIKIHQKYDLKGSTYKRKANKHEQEKASPTYKDLDFMDHHPEGLYLEAETYTALMKTIARDCRVLESFKIMDYSLLVGIHNLDAAAREKQERLKNQAVAAAAAASEAGESSAGPSSLENALITDNGDLGVETIVEGTSEQATAERIEPKESRRLANLKASLLRSKSINKQRLAAYSTAMESIQAEVEPIDEEDDVPPGGIPARNAQGERLLLFLGVIDILQSYRLKKKLEHTLKSVFSDGDTISVHRPGFYAQRFQDFMAKRVFKKIPSLDMPEIKGSHRKFRTLVSSFLALKHSPSKKRTPASRVPKSSGGDNSRVQLHVNDGGPQSTSSLGSPFFQRASLSARGIGGRACSLSVDTPTLSRKQHPNSPATPHRVKGSLRTAAIRNAAGQSISNTSINSADGGSSEETTLRKMSWVQAHLRDAPASTDSDESQMD